MNRTNGNNNPVYPVPPPYTPPSPRYTPTKISAVQAEARAFMRSIKDSETRIPKRAEVITAFLVIRESDPVHFQQIIAECIVVQFQTDTYLPALIFAGLINGSLPKPEEGEKKKTMATEILRFVQGYSHGNQRVQESASKLLDLPSQRTHTHPRQFPYECVTANTRNLGGSPPQEWEYSLKVMANVKKFGDNNFQQIYTSGDGNACGFHSVLGTTPKIGTTQQNGLFLSQHTEIRHLFGTFAVAMLSHKNDVFDPLALTAFHLKLQAMLNAFDSVRSSAPRTSQTISVENRALLKEFSVLFYSPQATIVDDILTAASSVLALIHTSKVTLTTLIAEKIATLPEIQDQLQDQLNDQHSKKKVLAAVNQMAAIIEEPLKWAEIQTREQRTMTIQTNLRGFAKLLPPELQGRVMAHATDDTQLLSSGAETLPPIERATSLAKTTALTINFDWISVSNELCDLGKVRQLMVYFEEQVLTALAEVSAPNYYNSVARNGHNLDLYDMSILARIVGHPINLTWVADNGRHYTVPLNSPLNSETSEFLRHNPTLSRMVNAIPIPAQGFLPTIHLVNEGTHYSRLIPLGETLTPATFPENAPVCDPKKGAIAAMEASQADTDAMFKNLPQDLFINTGLTRIVDSLNILRQTLRLTLFQQPIHGGDHLVVGAAATAHLPLHPPTPQKTVPYQTMASLTPAPPHRLP